MADRLPIVLLVVNERYQDIHPLIRQLLGTFLGVEVLLALSKEEIVRTLDQQDIRLVLIDGSFLGIEQIPHWLEAQDWVRTNVAARVPCGLVIGFLDLFEGPAEPVWGEKFRVDKLDTLGIIDAVFQQLAFVSEFAKMEAQP